MSEKETLNPNESVPFYPVHVSAEAKVVFGILAVVLIFGLVGLLHPLGIGAPADPMDTPAHVKPEWYFLALYQLLKYLPKTTGAVLPVIGVILVALLPFFDRKPETSRRVQRLRLIGVIVGVMILIGLTIWGEIS